MALCVTNRSKSEKTGLAVTVRPAVAGAGPRRRYPLGPNATQEECIALPHRSTTTVLILILVIVMIRLSPTRNLAGTDLAAIVLAMASLAKAALPPRAQVRFVARRRTISRSKRGSNGPLMAQ